MSDFIKLNSATENDLLALARDLASKLRPGDRVVLEGPMGAGKSTFARGLIHALGVDRDPEGSPTFALAHEYRTRLEQRVVHLDLYRVSDESELVDAGLDETFGDPQAIVIVEWLSCWPNFERRALEGVALGCTYRLSLDFVMGSAQARCVELVASHQ